MKEKGLPFCSQDDNNIGWNPIMIIQNKSVLKKKKIINGAPIQFNKHTYKLKKKRRVFCGINLGEILFTHAYYPNFYGTVIVS